MKFSSKTTYGLRALSRLAKSSGEIPVSLAKIAQEENISLGYLEKLFASFKKSGLVCSEKGASGGYRLAKRSEKITVLEIIKSLENNFSLFHCVDEAGKIYCRRKNKCGAAPVLLKVQKIVNASLKEISLKELVK